MISSTCAQNVRRANIRAIALVLAVCLTVPAIGNLTVFGAAAAPGEEFSSIQEPTDVLGHAGGDASTLDSEENEASYDTITSWPMFLNNPAHTSFAETPAPSTYTEFWNTTVGMTFGSPAVAEGLVFIGSQGSGVDYMNAYYVENGTLAWSTPTNESVAGGQGVRTTPAYWNGHVYFGADKIYCLYANNGTVRWTVDTPNVDYGSGIPTVANGRVYVGTNDAKVHSIDALTGQINWTFSARINPPNHGVLGAPAVVNNLVYVGAGDGFVYQINETQPGPIATANHTFNAKEPVYSSLVVENDRVYFGNGFWLNPTKKNRFFTLTANNLTEIWNFDSGGFDIYVSSAGTAYGNVYVSSSLGELYAFDALATTPIINWNYTIGESWSSVAIADDKLYVGAKSGQLYAFDAIQTSTVTYMWMQSLGGPVDSSPAISDGLVFVATQDGTGKLYAIGELGDNMAPTISGVLAAPDPQEVGGFVNVSALIADASGVGEAWLNVTLPESMTLISNLMLRDTPSGRYFREATYNELGIHDFLVSARDRAGNWNMTLGQFGTVDTTPPSILDVTAVPDPQEPFVPVNISAAVSDNHEISGAWVDIVDPIGTPVGNFSMRYDIGVDRYFNESTYSEIGTHNFTIWVRDVAGNWNSSQGTFVIRDVTLPEINAVMAVPDPQEVSNPVNISANITDDVAVALSTVEIRDPMGALVDNFTMSFDNSSARYYEEFTGSMIGMYTFTIWATDSSSNTVSSGGSFALEDWTRPTIIEIAATPDPQEVLAPVNITTWVIDNYAVANVFAEITDPSSTFYGNFTMPFDSGTGRYYYENDSYAMLGVWNVRVSAVDESNNWISAVDAFLIQDTLPPTIALVTANPDPQVIDGNVNISAQVTDNYVLSSVTVNITDPDSLTVYDGLMDYDPISARYYLNATYHKVGVFNFKIIANDSVGNPSERSGQFTMVSSPIDVQPPHIWNATADPDPQEVFGNVNITARIVDNFAVGIVWVHVYDPSMALLGNFSMTLDSGSGKHFYETLYSEIGGYTFQISANDTSGNVNSTTGAFQIIDTTPPEISNEAVDPDPQEVFGTSQASARVTDNYELSGVWIEITDPQGTNVGNFSMSFTGDVYHYDLTCELIGEYELLISASDSSGNWESTIVLLRCVDSTHPTVDAIAAPNPQEVHGYVNISALVQENYALDGAWVEIHDPDGLLVGNFSMAFDSSQSKYYYRTQYSKLGTYNYVVTAMDTSGNWGAEAATFQMRDTTPPIADAGSDVSISVGSQVTLDASGSTDNYGIASYEWTFDDGTGDKLLSGMTASHVFPEMGSFPVQLKVQDYSGNYDTDTMFVNVSVAPAPSPPSNLRVTDFGADFLVLEWDAPTTNADGSTLTDLVGYHYYRSFTQGGPYARLTGEPFTGTTLTDDFLHPGFKAYYVITAVNSIGLESVYSNEVLGETLQKGRIEGTVVDKNGNPISGALVELLGDRDIVITSTNTNSAGEYSFEDLFSGRYTLRGSKAGYTTATLVADVAYGDTTQPEPLVLDKVVPAGLEEALNLPILIPVILIVVVIAIILLMRRRKRKKLVYEMLEGLDIDDLELEVY